MSAISNLKLVSDGTPLGTSITCDGVQIEGVIGLTYEFESFGHLAVLTLRVEGVDCDAEALRAIVEELPAQSAAPSPPAPAPLPSPAHPGTASA